MDGSWAINWNLRGPRRGRNGTRGLSVENDCHGAVVGNLDVHAGAEDAGLDRDSQCRQRGAEDLVETLGELRGGAQCSNNLVRALPP